MCIPCLSPYPPSPSCRLAFCASPTQLIYYDHPGQHLLCPNTRFQRKRIWWVQLGSRQLWLIPARLEDQPEDGSSSQIPCLDSPRSRPWIKDSSTSLFGKKLEGHRSHFTFITPFVHLLGLSATLSSQKARKPLEPIEKATSAQPPRAQSRRAGSQSEGVNEDLIQTFLKRIVIYKH